MSSVWCKTLYGMSSVLGRGEKIMGLFKRKQVIPFESYFLHTPVHKNTPEHAVRWAVLDLEATGFDVHSDRILSVAVAIVENGQFQVDMRFVDDAPEDLRRGQSLRIRLQLGNSSPALLLDRGGFYQQTGGNWVYRVTENGNRAERRSIEIGRQNPDHFEILSGLTDGDKVIISNYEAFGENESLNLQ